GGKSGKPMMSKEVYVLVSHVVENSREGGRKRRFIQMRGVNDPTVSAAVHELKLAKGEWWSSSGVREVDDPEGKASSSAYIDRLAASSRNRGLDLKNLRVDPEAVYRVGPVWALVGEIAQQAWKKKASGGEATARGKVSVLEVVVGDGLARTLGSDIGKSEL